MFWQKSIRWKLISWKRSSVSAAKIAVSLSISLSSLSLGPCIVQQREHSDVPSHILLQRNQSYPKDGEAGRVCAYCEKGCHSCATSTRCLECTLATRSCSFGKSQKANLWWQWILQCSNVVCRYILVKIACCYFKTFQNRKTVQFWLTIHELEMTQCPPQHPL